MKKISLFICAIIIFFFCISFAHANEINNIDIEVYIDMNGNASVKEIWTTYLNEGSEGYRLYDLMGDAKISNFRVIDDTGREYDNLEQWSTSYSFTMKAYKSSINYTDDGIELCWGISQYGNRTYTLYYDISNFVNQYTDSQGVYFNMLNLDQNVDNVRIKIYSDTFFSLDNTRIWSFGYKGNIEFVNGTISMKTA